MLTFNETVISLQPAIFSHPFCLKHLIAVSSRWPRGPLVSICKIKYHTDIVNFGGTYWEGAFIREGYLF